MKLVCFLFAVFATVAARPSYLQEVGTHGAFAGDVGYHIPVPRLPEIGLSVDTFPFPYPIISNKFITVSLPALEYQQPKLYANRY